MKADSRGYWAHVNQTGNVGHDQTDSRWPTYERVLSQIHAWPRKNCPIVMCEDDQEIGRMPDLAVKVTQWTADAKRVAYGHFR
jgi:hypothetical protein